MEDISPTDSSFISMHLQAGVQFVFRVYVNECQFQLNILDFNGKWQIRWKNGHGRGKRYVSTDINMDNIELIRNNAKPENMFYICDHKSSWKSLLEMSAFSIYREEYIWCQIVKSDKF